MQTNQVFVIVLSHCWCQYKETKIQAERECQAVIHAWECVKLGCFCARCQLSPSCYLGSLPIVLAGSVFKCFLCTNTHCTVIVRCQERREKLFILAWNIWHHGWVKIQLTSSRGPKHRLASKNSQPCEGKLDKKKIMFSAAPYSIPSTSSYLGWHLFVTMSVFKLMEIDALVIIVKAEVG